VVVGNSGSTDGTRAFRWTSSEGMVSLGTLAGGTLSSASAVNADGSVVVGYSHGINGARAFIWRGVMQDDTNLRSSFPLLASATEAAMWQNAGWLTQLMDGGCEIAEGHSTCVSVTGAAGTRNSVAGDGSWRDKISGLTSLSLSTRLDERAMAGLIVGAGPGSKGDIVGSDGSLLGLGGYLRWSKTGDYRNGLNLRSDFGWSHGKATFMRGSGLTDVETARATAKINAITASAEASYGIAVSSDWFVSPRIGIRWQRATRAFYVEDGNLAFSAEYGKAATRALTLTFGIDPTWKINDSSALQFRIGGEHDLHVDKARLWGASNVPGLESFNVASNLNRNNLRGVAGVSYVMSLAAGKVLRANIQIGTPVYGSGILTAGSIVLNVNF
jgi:probable HAF family extracellular repeat protein